MGSFKVPIRYLPNSLTRKDKQTQKRMLIRSRKMYKQGKYYTRKKIGSYRNRKSNHIQDARNIYKIQTITPNKQLSLATGCSLSALRKIVNIGEGAYFSSGSRPNQTPQSWGLARLASSITSGKSAAIDYNILDKGCDHSKTAFRLAQKSKEKYKHGQSKTRKVVF
jgi:hypothetical protein